MRACIAEETGVRVHVSHFPPGSSKWNKIEHRPVLSHHAQLARQADANL